MKPIQQHIDFLFQDVPATETIKRIKNDLYLNAMDRYDELLAHGKTESEALGTIIIEMGDREDLLDSLDYNQEADLKDYSTNTLGEAKVLVNAYQTASTKIGLGIFLILAGAGLIPSFNTFNMVEVGVILLLLLVALGVGLFIHTGLRLEAIEQTIEDDEHIFYLTDDDYEIVLHQYDVYKDKNSYRIPLGVMLCILSVLPVLVLAFLENQLLVERYGIILLLLLVGLGVYQFISYGMNETAYEKVLNLGEYSIEERQFQKKIEPLVGIYWMLVTAVYLGWSFFSLNWHFTWIIWPIAGAVWALIAMVAKLFMDREQL